MTHEVLLIAHAMEALTVYILNCMCTCRVVVGICVGSGQVLQPHRALLHVEID